MGAVDRSSAQALQLELAYQVTTDGKATVRVRGELDIATADQAYAYLRDVVDSQDGPVHDEPVRADLLRRGGPWRARPGRRARAALRPLARS